MNNILFVTIICVVIWMYTLYSYIMEDCVINPRGDKCSLVRTVWPANAGH